ncbi:zinc-binding alcohol dehydrogenase [Paenibacillus sp. HB172176]|uniref:zinc-dependent alcohol dehydrogenase n=1 Tax=Paenibacillus sp. HB172176 TaxID=2493690 RepID=UPI00143A8BD8|nr:zinc-binding alcohol dehydrogenase [Paenibacillus sp. HB172176]
MESLRIVFSDKQQVEVKKEQFDSTLKGEELLCRAICSLVSTGTELQCLRGVFDSGTNWANWVQYPFYPGYCMVAEVLEVGADVQGIRQGDRVFAEVSHASCFKIKAARAFLLPEEIASEQAVWINLAKTTQLGARRAELQLGESVGVIGLGLLGQLVTRYLHLSGAKTLFAIDPAADRMRFLPQMPGIRPLCMDVVSAHEEIDKATRGEMLDVVFDVTGHPSVLAQATRLVKRMGRIILLGDTATPSQQGIGRNVVSDSLSIQGIHAGMDYKTWNHPRMAELFLTFAGQGRMDTSNLVTHRYSPMDAVQAYELLVANRTSAMGVLFDWASLDRAK